MKLLTTAVVAVVLGTAGLSAQAQTYGFGTMGQGTNSFSTGSAIAKLMVEDLGLQARVQPSGGTTDFLPDLNGGFLDFGIANILEASDAFNGEGAWQGNPLTNLRIASVVAPLRVAMFVRADSDIQSIADLKGKRVTSQFTRIQTLSKVFPATLANGGLTLDDIIEVPVPHVVPGADAFLDGRADAFFFAVVPSKPAEVHASVPLRVLPFDDGPEAVARMQEIFPFGRIGTVNPAPPLAFVTAPTNIMEYDNLMITADHVPAAVLEEVAAGLAAGKEQLAATYPALRAFNPAGMVLDGAPVPYHDGVLAWAAKQ